MVMSQRYLSRGCRGLIGMLIAMGMPGTALHAATQPPTGAVTAELGFPSVGTVYAYDYAWELPEMRDTEYAADGRGGGREVYTVIDDAIHDGRPVHRAKKGGSDTLLLVDKATGGLTAIVHEGKEIFAFSPALGLLFPLWVGKSWTSTHIFRTYNEYEGQQTFPNVVWRGKVSAYEEVTVPAGTFKAFKVEGAGTLPTVGDNRVVWWYAPELHITVKHIRDRLAGGPLIGGHQKHTYELSEYVPK
jgi:hypothetical protein